MLNIRAILNRGVLSLFALLFSFSFVKANFGDCLVKFGVGSNETCSECGIEFGEATRKLCYDWFFYPGGRLSKEKTKFAPWHDKFGDFCFIDLRDNECQESCYTVSNGSKKYCRACMIKRLVEIKDKDGFKLREFKSCSLRLLNSNCPICYEEFGKEDAYYVCENGHGVCKKCFMDYAYWCHGDTSPSTDYKCPVCRQTEEVGSSLSKKIRFIQDWEVS